jgi:hypothetical protein
MGDLKKRLEETFQVDQRKKQETRISTTYIKKRTSKARSKKTYFTSCWLSVKSYLFTIISRGRP